MNKKTQIMNTVRDRIVSNFNPGQRLPGVAEVCDEFDVGTSTAVYAMRALAAEGYVVTRQGDGYFVAEDLPSGERSEGLTDVVIQLREEAKRLSALADRLERLL